jgi:hypothetical protein
MEEALLREVSRPNLDWCVDYGVSAFVHLFLAFVSRLTSSNTEWSGINALLYYGPTLIQSIGLQGDTPTLLVSGGIGIVQLLAVVPAIIWIDRVGQRALLRG